MVDVTEEKRTLVGFLKAEWLLVAVALLYAGIAIAQPQKAFKALSVGAHELVFVSVIIISVFGLVGLVGTLVDKKKIAGKLGDSSGLGAVLGAALFGSVLVGPVYAVFPLLKTIRDHGARWAVIAAMLTSWAVKIPMIPLEIGYLGLRFSVVRIVLTVIGAIAMGYGIEWVMNKIEKPAGE